MNQFSLDVSVQAEFNMLQDMEDEYGLTLRSSHDLSVVKNVRSLPYDWERFVKLVMEM